MAIQNDTTQETDLAQKLHGFASRAMEIYAIADMLAENIEAADEPGPACRAIAITAHALNQELFQLALDMHLDKATAERAETAGGAS